MKNIDTKFGLVYITNKEEFENNIRECLSKNNYNIDSKNDYYIISKKAKSNWVDNLIFPCNRESCEESKKFRFVLFLYEMDIYYFEKNGAVNCIDGILIKCKPDYFEKSSWKKNYDDELSFIENIRKYELTHHVNNEIKGFKNNEYSYLHDFTNFHYNYEDYNKLYQGIEELEENYKLPKYKELECKENEKSSETKYNSLVCCLNPNYILLDRSCLDGCEVADIYDRNHKLLFHNKKRGDLRVVSMQIVIGALIMKNPERCEKYYNMLLKKGISDDIDRDNFSFVVGIIGNNKNISNKDRISLGIVKHILQQHNIQLFIDFIEMEA